jgi:hypothetical protein
MTGWEGPFDGNSEDTIVTELSMDVPGTPEVFHQDQDGKGGIAMRVNGKVVVVTGASSGIGATTAKAMAKKGGRWLMTKTGYHRMQTHG